MIAKAREKGTQQAVEPTALYKLFNKRLTLPA